MTIANLLSTSRRETDNLIFFDFSHSGTDFGFHNSSE